MSFLDDSSELAADLADVFNILYPPSPSSTVQYEFEEEGNPTVTIPKGGPAEIVDLDGPVKDLAPLDIHELSSHDINHESTADSKFPGYVESLLGKLSRVRKYLTSEISLLNIVCNR